MLLYRLLMSLVALAELTRRVLRADWAGLKARLGRTQPVSDTRHVWVHAASNGELMSARPVLTRLAQGSDRRVFLTVNTDSALDLARRWNIDGVTPHLAPLDLRGAATRTYARWNIDAHIALESDLWPTRILTCPGPVLVLGGRLTDRSARGWRRFEGIARRVLGKVTYLSAQDEGSRDRFLSLGLDPGAVGPVIDLKSLYTRPTDEPDDDLRAAFPRDATWLAASTHEGEDETVLVAHKTLLDIAPETRLILAPRHPRRGDALATLITDTGLTLARRSTGDDPGQAQVYLADTMGEMHLWYALCGRVFVAGSLTDRGGHTPYEPAAFGCAILHGSDVGNFRAAYARLQTRNAALEIDSAESLATALHQLSDATSQSQMGQAAQDALAQETDIDGLMQDITKALKT